MRLAPSNDAPRHSVRSILPYQPEHLALLVLRIEQRGEAERFGMTPGQLAEHGPAFTAAELDEQGRVQRVLSCYGLAEATPPTDPSGGRALAWAGMAEGLSKSEWGFVTACCRSLLDHCGHARIELAVTAGFDAGHRYARGLGFTLDSMVYARSSARGDRQISPSPHEGAI